MRRFFRTLWRINAVLICVAAVLVAFVCAVASYYIIKEVGGRSSEPRNAAVIGDRPESKRTDWTISSASRLDGTNTVRCALISQDYYSGIGFSKDSSATRNYLHYDLSTDKTRWALPNHNSVVIRQEDYYFPASPYDQRSARWVSYLVASKDTNHDRKLASDDLLDFAISLPDGSDYTVLISELDSVFETALVNDVELLVFYRKHGSSFVSRLNLTSKQIIVTHDLID